MGYSSAMNEPTAAEKAQKKIAAVEALLAWKAKRNLSVEDIARRLDVSNSTLYNWLNGDALPTGEPLAKLQALVKSK